MMKARVPWDLDGSCLGMVVAVGAPLLVTADASIREGYHLVSSEALNLVVSTGVAVLAGLVCLLARQWRGRAFGLRTHRVLSVASLAYATPALLASALSTRTGFGLYPVAIGIAGAVALAGLLAIQRGGDTWRRFALAGLIGLMLFVVSQPLIGTFRAPEQRWPPGLHPEDATHDRGRRLTLVLLLDELNAGAAGPFVEELRSAGLAVALKGVPSVGDNTASAVPAMFLEHRFDDPRPCALSIICSRDGALDFARITASRPDIDVVGFFHPYCAILGLRHCSRVVSGLAIAAPLRWRCALERRLGTWMDGDREVCTRAWAESWSGMVDRVLAALLEAPALREGGVLFAHVPLPHPPARPQGLESSSLAADYALNIERARMLLRDALTTARSSGLQTRVVIFSDHPLRQEQWCGAYEPYQWAGCRPSQRLHDTRVPLIVAGETVPDLSTHESNLRVFSLLAAWQPVASR